MVVCPDTERVPVRLTLVAVVSAARVVVVPTERALSTMTVGPFNLASPDTERVPSSVILSVSTSFK